MEVAVRQVPWAGAGPLGSILWGQMWQARLDPKSKAGAKIQWASHSVTSIPVRKMLKPLLRTVPTPLPASGGSSRERPLQTDHRWLHI